MLGEIAFDGLGDLVSTLDRRSRRQASLKQDEALIFGRQKATRQAHEQYGQQQHRQRVNAKVPPAPVNHRGHPAVIAVAHTLEGAIEPRLAAGHSGSEPGHPAREPPRLAGFGFGRRRAQQGAGQRRTEDQRDQHGQHHRRNDRQRKLAVDHPGRAAEKGHRQDHGRKHQRDRHQRDLDFLHGLDRRFVRRHARVLVHQPLDVLDHHDRIVDQQADRQHEAEQGQRVDREARQIEHPERHDRLDQRFDHFGDGELDESRGVVDVVVFDPVGKSAAEFADFGLDQFRSAQRICPRRQRDRQPGCRVTVEAADRRIAFRSHFDPGDVLELDGRAVRQGLDHDLGELLGRLQPALRGHRGVQHLPRRRGKPAHFACCHFGILGRQRRHDVAGHQRDRCEPLRVEPDPHRMRRAEHADIADPGHPRQRILNVGRQIVRDIGIAALAGHVVD